MMPFSWRVSLQRFVLPIGVFLLAGLLVWLLFFWEPAERATPQPGVELALARVPEGGDFTLSGPDGPVALADFRGKVVVLYFGYTSCPDVCVSSLSLIAQAFSRLDERSLARVQGIFISVDPARDTPARLADYVPFFHPRLIGLTGTTAEIERVAYQYGSRYRLFPKDSDGNYAVDHSSVTYVLGTDGKLSTVLPGSALPAALAAEIDVALGR